MALPAAKRMGLDVSPRELSPGWSEDYVLISGRIHQQSQGESLLYLIGHVVVLDK